MKRVTQRDIAKEAKVSRVLVSMVLNGKNQNEKICSKEVQERIETIAKRMNYRVNRSAYFMKQHSHGSIGILAKDLGAEVGSNLFSLILHEVKNYDRTLLLEQLPDDLDEKVILLDDCVVDGVIIFSEMPPKIIDMLEAIHERVLYFNTSRREGSDVVTINDEKGGYDAAKKLVDAGKKKIVYMVWGQEPWFHYSVLARLNGLKQCCREHGVEFAGQIDIVGLLPNHVSFEEAGHVIYDKISGVGFDGVVLHSDLLAPPFYYAARRLGKRVPEDCSVISFNNSNVSYSLNPKLASFGLDAKKTSALIIKRMMDLIEKKEGLKTINIPLELFDGGSI